MGELEFDGDAENMTKRDKEKMLHRLSIKPSTEKFFRNEQALSTYIENTIQSYGAIPLSNISNLVMGFLLFYLDIRKGLSDVRT